MTAVTPQVLLDNPELVEPLAPWCVALDNLELGILLVSQPWLAGDGLRRAEIERRLGRLGADLPFGPTYFQRIRRTVEVLERRGALQARGEGRARRFRLSPHGFAALVVNLRVLRGDPTVDGAEFELKRALVGMWNLVLDRMTHLPNRAETAPDLERFFNEVDTVEVWGTRVVTDELVAMACDVLGLITLQRERVLRLREAFARRLHSESPASTLDLDTAGPEGSSLEAIRFLTARSASRLDLRARLARYEAYLGYLDTLTSLYANELHVVDIRAFRHAVTGRSR